VWIKIKSTIRIKILEAKKFAIDANLKKLVVKKSFLCQLAEVVIVAVVMMSWGTCVLECLKKGNTTLSYVTLLYLLVVAIGGTMLFTPQLSIGAEL